VTSDCCGVDGASCIIAPILEAARPPETPQLPPDPPDPRPLLLTIEEVSRLLALGRSRVYEMVVDKTIPSVKIGRSRRIRLVDLERYVEGLG
jgi:excisionase family DNA binding protein